MKRILLLCCLFVATGTMAIAQTTSNPNPEPKTVFASNASQYNAGVQRNNSQLAQAGFSNAMTFISNSIAQLTQQMNSASSQASKAALNAKIQSQQTIYNNLQALQSNIMSNANQIKTNFQSFESTL